MAARDREEILTRYRGLREISTRLHRKIATGARTARRRSAATWTAVRVVAAGSAACVSAVHPCFNSRASSQNPLHQFAMHVRQPKISPLKPICQPRVIKPQQM